ncbi:methyltransferase [Micromonospora foliorum]|uniref:methyltransferase n=2 Tax=Micromonospora TaxID=1873 RepID=UPI001EE86225|nr:methyltransferase [Micromonospora foliorum]MCG5438999.1 methyltransferase domain-containing protein [Micromonospora foliorum]
MPEPDPQSRMMAILHAPLITQMVVAVAELGIADQLADGPQPVEVLAAKADARPEALHRILRALAGVGVVAQPAPGVYGPTPLLDTLRTDAPGSLHAWARLWGLPERQAALTALTLGLRDERPPFEQIYDLSWWAHLERRPEQAAVFRDAMGDLSRQLHAQAVAAYDFSGVRRVCDVGGGTGSLVATLLRSYPTLTAVLLDRPAVVAHADAVLDAAGVADRVTVESGDFFTAVPGGADAYLLSMILHDWTDEQVVTVLTNVRRVIDPNGRLFVVDAVIPEDDQPHDGKLRDIIMLALHPGRERTEREFGAVFDRAGFRLAETREVSASTGLLVAVPV